MTAIHTETTFEEAIENFKPADQLFFDQVEAEAVTSEDIRQAATANTRDDFKLVFEKRLDDLFIDRMEGNDEIFRRVMQDGDFRNVVAEYLLRRVYQQARCRAADSDDLSCFNDSGENPTYQTP